MTRRFAIYLFDVVAHSTFRASMKAARAEAFDDGCEKWCHASTNLRRKDSDRRSRTISSDSSREFERPLWPVSADSGSLDGVGVSRSHPTEVIPMSLVRSSSRLLATILLFVSAPSHAAYYLESFGYFTSWTGAVGSDGQLTSYINGQVVCPDAGCGTGIGVYTDPSPSDPGCDFGIFCVSPETVDFVQTDIFANPPPPPNQVSITGTPLIESFLAGRTFETGDEIVIAKLRYVNGRWYTGPNLGFEIFATGFTCTGNTCGAAIGGSWADVLEITVTPNTGTPQANADRLCFRDHPQFGCFAVWEPQDTPDPYGEVELKGRIGSLTPTGFGQVLSGGFIDLPEPSLAASTAIGFVGIMVASRRRCRVESSQFE